MSQVPCTLVPAGYWLCQGSNLDRALLLKFLRRTYAELQPEGDFSHLSATVDQYFSADTPLWWVEQDAPQQDAGLPSLWGNQPRRTKVACLWLGNAVDQLRGDRHTHVFLLYVALDHRRQGIGTALMKQAEVWARARGDRKIGLQVFQRNQPALNLYQSLGYTPESLWMSKDLPEPES